MLECERLFGVVRGGEIKALVEDATGGPCPCLAGRPCPLSKGETARAAAVAAAVVVVKVAGLWAY